MEAWMNSAWPDNAEQEGPTDSPATVFQKQWQTYRKILDSNYMFHREVYGRLRQILIDEAIQPFRFLDIACGDAAATCTALTGLKVGAYYGIDLSQPALDLARESVETLGCPVTLQCRDFVEVLRDWKESVDVAWIGQSLHHLQLVDKLLLMRRIRHIVGDRGLFLIWEAISFDGETREAWFRRYEQIRPVFTSLSAEEWDTMAEHTRMADIPETNAQWHSLGHEAGFSKTRELFVAPHQLSAMYCFSP
jgi:ubiquinone/menaquinone biosynthesis C-methylase UbiE